MDPGPRIAIIDDEAAITRAFAHEFADEYSILQLNSAGDALASLDDSIQVAVVDERMPGMSGIELLCQLRIHRPNIIRILITAYGDEYLAAAVNQARIFHYVEKPPDPRLLRHVLRDAIHEFRVRQKGEQELKRLEREREALAAQVVQANQLRERGREQLLRVEHERDIIAAQKRVLLDHEALGFSAIAGKSASLAAVIEKARKAVDKSISILIHGESGTGKDILARAIHYEGATRAEFRAINLAPFVEESIIRSELFGTVKGAFTGAIDRPGIFEVAHKGTVFLNEIAEMPLSVQAMLLSFLDNGELTRVGSTKTIRTDVRVIAATNQDLRAMVANKRFREDLYYRLAQFELTLPPLRDRREDIETLIDFFIDRAGAEMGQALQLSVEARQALLEYSFPGNVRELRNTIGGAAAICENGRIEMPDLPPRIFSRPDDASVALSLAPLAERVAEFESAEIRKTLAQTPTQKEAARRLGITPEWLRRIKKDRGID